MSSSRKIEWATYDLVSFRYVAGNTHPDHDTLVTFPRRFLKDIEGFFVQVLLLSREMKLLSLSAAALDCTKIKANASKHGRCRGRMRSASKRSCARKCKR